MSETVISPAGLQPETNKLAQTINTLANINEMTRLIMMDIMGNDMADTINGQPLSINAVYNLTQSVIARELQSYRRV
jgi:hypothetical protein